MSLESPEMLKFKDIDKGQKGFILAGGPSMKLLEFIPKEVPQIVVNEGALKVPWAKYACTMDSTVYRYMYNMQLQGKGAMLKHIFSVSVTGETESYGNVHLETRPGYDYMFSLDPSRYLFNIDSPAYVALQLALYFGWSETYMMGVDYCVDPENGDTHYYGKKKGYLDEMGMGFQMERSSTIFAHKIIDLKALGYKIYSCSPYSKLNCAAHYVHIQDAVNAL